MRTAGETPGLRLFESEEEDTQVGLWERIKSLFTAPPGYDEDILDPEGAAGVGYEDLSGVGSGWVGENEGGLEGEDMEDLGQVMMIFGVAGLVVGLIWLRARWTAWAEETERRRRGREQQGARGDGLAVAGPVLGVFGDGQLGGDLPEPLIDAPIP